ncbi:MAG: glutathione S-transferase family protein [Betaproteobacteria bacterium]|nr:glutathione S-transferase family protein [Betaproteobacteria bacterium]
MSRILYVGTKNASSWSLRAWLSLREQRIEFEEVLVDLRVPARFEALSRIGAFSPPAAVPVLVDGDTVIYDSLAIMEYANELGVQAGRVSLLPTDMKLRAHARSLMAWQHSGLSAVCPALSFESVFYPSPRPAAAEEQDQARRVLAAWSGELARSGGPYLLGALSLADLVFVPTVQRLQAHGIAFDGFAHVAEWAARLLARASVQEWMREAASLPPVILEGDA